MGCGKSKAVAEQPKTNPPSSEKPQEPAQDLGPASPDCFDAKLNHQAQPLGLLLIEDQGQIRVEMVLDGEVTRQGVDIAKGDVILGIDQKPLTRLQEYHSMVQSTQSLVLRIKRPQTQEADKEPVQAVEPDASTAPPDEAKDEIKDEAPQDGAPLENMLGAATAGTEEKLDLAAAPTPVPVEIGAEKEGSKCCVCKFP